MKNFWWIVRYVKPYSGYAVMNIVTNILSVVFSLFSLTMVIPFLNLLFGMQKLERTPPEHFMSASGLLQGFNYFISKIIIEQGNVHALLFVCILVVAMMFFKNLFRYLGMYYISPIRAGVVKDMRNELYQKVTALPLSFYNKERKGDIIARMTNDVQEIEWAILSSIEAVFREPFTIIAFLGTMLWMSPQLTLFIFIMLPLTGLIIGRIGKSLKKTSAEGQLKMGILLSVIEETLGGLRIIKAFTAEAFTHKKFKHVNDEFERLTIKMLRRRDLASPMSEFLGVTVLVIVMWYGGGLIFGNKGGLQPSIFIAYIGIFSQILNPAKSFTTAYYNAQKGIASAERVRMILDAPLVILEKPDATSIHGFTKEIEYRNLSFAYNNFDDSPILKNINLTIQKGKTIALVGQSGAGKTTMADLLPRFYDITHGELLIDGISIKDLKLQDLRKLIGVVSQESILFNDSVFNNIAFGIEEATLEDVIEAARIANAHEFISELSEGYYTNIGDRGMKLSGGQRQRLSIARAVLKNPPILILDEATSALDTESERLVQDALAKLMQNRTSLVIAHRLSTIQHADEIIVMNRGEIIERGTHFDLLETPGTYKKLYELQAFI